MYNKSAFTSSVSLLLILEAVIQYLVSNFYFSIYSGFKHVAQNSLKVKVINFLKPVYYIHVKSL